MNRKDFLFSSSLMAASAFTAFNTGMVDDNEAFLPLVPPYLKKGDIIGITCPAGHITLADIQPAVNVMESWGYKIRIGDAIGKKDFTFGGTDKERLNDFQRMLDDGQVKAIMAARGGYGAIRIIDKLKWEKFRQRPKWIIGFSDITVFHSFINRKFGIASIHSKMCNSFPDDWTRAEPVQIETILSIRDALGGKKMKYVAPVNPNNRQGAGEGTLVGGNLKTLETMSGSPSDLITTNKILFVEDAGEYMYSIDRMFWNLERSGKLSELKGLIIGGFRVKTDADTEDFGKKLEDIVMEKVGKYHYPVCFDFPVGHQRNNFALKCGVRHRLAVGDFNSTLTEI